jgi:iron complex outermembrane recepter protein
MRILVCFILSLFAVVSRSENVLTGKVVDPDNQPVSQFNLVLISPSDSSTISSTSFTDGIYTLKDIQPNEYIIKITSFGYAALKKTVKTRSGVTSLPTLVLQPNCIKEITVVAQQPTIRSTADRIIINVENSILSNALNGTDMLQKTPGLIRDTSGELIVAGKGIPKYYIDGKEVHSLNEVRILNPKNIQSLEIIDNPSAVYDADGHAVILINTLNRADQYLLRLGGDFTQSRKGSVSEFIEGALKTGKITTSLYVDHSTTNNKTFEDNYSVISDNNNLETHAESISFDSETSYRLSVDIDITKNQSLIFQSNGFYTDVSKINRNQLSYFSNLAFDNFNTHVEKFIKSWQTNNTISYNFKIDSLGQNIKLIADYTIGNKENTNNFYNQIVGAENNPLFWNKNYNNGKPVIYSIKADYTKPFSKIMILDVGTKYYWIKGNDITDMTGSTNLYQHYLTDEQNLSAYASLNMKLDDKIEFRVGLRGEKTFRKIQKDYVIFSDANQFGLFPSASINYFSSDAFSTGISYSKRISRPSFSALDPSIYVDSLTNRKGNPNLISTDIHSFQLSCKLFSSFSFRIGYSYLIHPIYFMVYKDELQPQLTNVRFVNGDNVGRYTASLTFNKQLFTWWSTTLSGFFYASSYLYVDDNNVKQNNNTPGKNITLQNSIKLPAKILFEIGYQYIGDASWTTSYNKAYSNLYFSLQRSFLHESLTCTLNTNDLFNKLTSRQHSVLSGHNFNIFDADDTYFGLSIKYQIGRSKYKYSSKSESTDERERIY